MNDRLQLVRPFPQPMVAGATGRRRRGGAVAVRQIAFMGDSQTELGFTNLTLYNGVGPATHARAFGGARWDAAKNGSKLEFASGGFRTEQIVAAHHAEVLASASELVVLAMGINDCFQLIANATIIDNIMDEAAALRASGRRVVVCTITPCTTVPEIANGRTPGSISAKIAAVNVLLRAELAAAGIPCCDTESLLTLSGTNDGVANADYFADGLHPSLLGASRWGRQLAGTLAAATALRFPLDNWSNTSWVTTNSALAGPNGNNPTGWSASGGGLSAKTFTSTPEGNWWQVTSDGTACYVDNFSANLGGSVASKTLESIVELEVISGSLRQFELKTSVSQITGNTGNTSAASGGTAADGVITAADGIVVFRTPAVTLGTASGGSPLAWAGLVFVTTAGATIRIRRLGARETVLL